MKIEAQMSRQWWKAKADGSTQPYTVPPSQDPAPIVQGPEGGAASTVIEGNDLIQVGRVTGVTVRETVPDATLERAQFRCR